MILTVFGDVHGNVVALKQLFQIEKDKTDLFICHGDIVNYAPWSNECVAFLNDIPNIKILKGNHEEYFISGIYPGQNQVAQSFFNFCYPKFNKNLLPIIEGYKDTLVTDAAVIQHTINNQYVFFDSDLSDLQLDANYMIGHSHHQFEREINGFKLYNTGSLGQNRKYLNEANYLQIDTESNIVHLKSFIYDIDVVINEMKAQKYPEICINYYLSKEKR